jgi:nanoRNase/pAp phosphatase (c-di-AMP/oligoRNAs hydrolase)
MTPEQILKVPDVHERVRRYFEQENAYQKMIQQNSTADGNVLIVDLRNVEKIVSGNRFKEYVMFPEQNVSIRILWGLNKQNVVFACGYSIINRTCKADIGSLMLKHGGGGHAYVGTCQVPAEKAAQVRDELVAAMKAAK